MRRALRIVGGYSLLVAGVPMLFLPGPGVLAVLAGARLLSAELDWAADASDWAKKKAALIRERPTRG